MADTGLIAAACVVVMSVGLAATFAPSYRSPPAPSPAVDTGASAAAATPAPAPPVSPARQAELEHMVIQDCGSCHGLTMKGGLGKPITPGDLAGFDPEGLAAIILDGVPGTAMPPWRPLISEPEALWIAEYLMKEKTE
ncbi:cytochrome c55X [Paracoccus solventivorans]|uniref:Cytochrome c55X n=1 Tax=Paracoccus solventivorans TaxID=53463 RepID=A0A1M7IAC6_9RHOB|nr:cytochrome c55X [Paracoccus solventivorans]